MHKLPFSLCQIGTFFIGYKHQYLATHPTRTENDLVFIWSLKNNHQRWGGEAPARQNTERGSVRNCRWKSTYDRNGHCKIQLTMFKCLHNKKARMLSNQFRQITSKFPKISIFAFMSFSISLKMFHSKESITWKWNLTWGNLKNVKNLQDCSKTDTGNKPRMLIPNNWVSVEFQFAIF